VAHAAVDSEYFSGGGKADGAAGASTGLSKTETLLSMDRGSGGARQTSACTKFSRYNRRLEKYLPDARDFISNKPN
jgi:hypothetical protein